MKPKNLPKRLNPEESRKAVAKARRMAAESNKRMNGYTKEQRAELEKQARAVINHEVAHGAPDGPADDVEIGDRRANGRSRDGFRPRDTPAEEREFSRQRNEELLNALRGYDTEEKLLEPAVMLATLQMAYSHALDECAAPFGRNPRLSPEEVHELGRRLAQYWTLRLPSK